MTDADSSSVCMLHHQYFRRCRARAIFLIICHADIYTFSRAVYTKKKTVELFEDLFLLPFSEEAANLRQAAADNLNIVGVKYVFGDQASILRR